MYQNIKNKNNINILAVETSCDETSIAILNFKKKDKEVRVKILSNVVASQIKIHAKWGGVVPNLAKREHQRNLPIVLKRSLKESGLLKILNSKSKIPKIDLLAVTIGPGLEPSLWTGINFAQNLAKQWGKPIIGINHLEGHIASAFLKEGQKILRRKSRDTKNSFGFQISDFKIPSMALLVSGGHTELVLIKDWLKYKIIGQTRDDAAGEAFDKAAKMLGLPYPGGPEIAKMAETISNSEFLISKQIPNNKFQIKLPRPMINSKDYDFSFSGLKTALLYLLRDLRQKGLNTDNRLLKANICKEFQQAVIDVLIKKTIKAMRDYNIQTLILGGGVTANQELRRQMENALKKEIQNFNLLIPDLKFTTDNAAMIGFAAYFHVIKNSSILLRGWKNLTADGNLNL